MMTDKEQLIADAIKLGINYGAMPATAYFIFEVNDLRNFIRATFTAPTSPHEDQKGQ